MKTNLAGIGVSFGAVAAGFITTTGLSIAHDNVEEEKKRRKEGKLEGGSFFVPDL